MVGTPEEPYRYAVSAPSTTRRRPETLDEPLAALAARERQHAAVAAFGRRALAASEADEPQLIDHAVAIVVETLRATHAGFVQLNPTGETATLRAGSGWPDGLVGRVVVPVTPESQVGYTFSAGEAVVFNDLSRETRFQPSPMLIEHGIVSGISVLVGLPGVSFGKLGVYSSHARNFDGQEANFLEAMANVLAQAIRRARSDADLVSSLTALRAGDIERRKLIAALVQAQEVERGRMAAEIHDDAVQVMAAVGMRLHAFRREMSPADPDGALSRLEEAVSVATGRLRRLLVDLRLPALDSDGLAAGIRMYLEQLQAETDLTYRLESSVRSEPPVEIRMVIYRIVQEALANTRKHAAASRVAVLISEVDHGVLVSVDDNGIGVDRQAAREPGYDRGRHVGITVMRERAAQLGGSCDVLPLGSGGTRVVAWLPLNAWTANAVVPS